MITKYNLMMDEDRIPVMVKESEYEYAHVGINSPGAVAEMLNKCLHMNDLCEEYVYLVCVNNAFTQPYQIFEISHGTVNHSLVSPREILQRALMCGASGLFLAYNHPSGDPEPSEEDIMVAKGLYEAASVIGLKFLDFLIIGGETYYSFAENELI